MPAATRQRTKTLVSARLRDARGRRRSPQRGDDDEEREQEREVPAATMSRGHGSLSMRRRKGRGGRNPSECERSGERTGRARMGVEWAKLAFAASRAAVFFFFPKCPRHVFAGGLEPRGAGFTVHDSICRTGQYNSLVTVR